jgi:hypothetical protein
MVCRTPVALVGVQPTLCFCSSCGLCSELISSAIIRYGRCRTDMNTNDSLNHNLAAGEECLSSGLLIVTQTETPCHLGKVCDIVFHV